MFRVIVTIIDFADCDAQRKFWEKEKVNLICLPRKRVVVSLSAGDQTHFDDDSVQ